jgi:HK97 family phage portal protein
MPFKVMTDAEVIADAKSLQTGVDNEPRFDFHQWLQTGRSGSMARFADEATYKRISWVYACVNAVAKNMASTPMRFFNEANMSQIINKNAPINVLFNPPNAPEIESLGQLILRTYVNTGLQGLAYWVFLRGDSNNFERIQLYKKGQLRPITTAGSNPNDQNQEFAQLLGWELRNRSGQRLAVFTPNQVLAIRYYDPSHRYAGLAPVTAARLAVEQEFNQSAWNAAFFKQGLRNPIALKYKNVLTKDQRDEMRKQLVAYYAGVENGQSGMILEGNVEVQDLGLTTKDIDFIEGKNMTREEIAASYGVPPAVIGIFRFANYANTREQRKILWEQTLIPLQDALIDMLQAIVLDTEFPGIIAKFDRSMIDVLKPDPIRAARAAETYQEMGYSKAQIAVILDMPQLNVDEENVSGEAKHTIAQRSEVGKASPHSARFYG